jgi:hypothetical protein
MAALSEVWLGGFNQGFSDRYQKALPKVAGAAAAPPSAPTSNLPAVPDASHRLPLAGSLPSAPPINLPAVPAVTGQTSDAGGGDSEHRVYIDVRGLAPGMRSGIESGSGPAKVSLRTRYMMDTAW